MAFVLSASHHGSLLVNRHDYQLTDDGGYGVGYQLLNASSFDQDEVELALQMIDARRQRFGHGVVCLDCGANIGVHTIEWARHMHGWGEVIAFEAQERIFYALAGNVAMNNCFNARAVWAAVGEEVGEIGVPVPDYFRPSSFGSLEIRHTERTEFIGQDIDYGKVSRTRLVSIDSLDLPRIDFIKIDIEGMEMEALRGAVRSIERHRPLLLVERLKTREQDIADFLSARGYILLPLGINVLAAHESDPVSHFIRGAARRSTAAP
jgi:FkbM family methyltransferase